MNPEAYEKKPHVQLLSYSKEEEHLYSPQGPSYFRPSYQQHSPFAIDRYPHRILNARFGQSVRVILTAPTSNDQMINYVGRRGDILGSLLLEVRLPKLVSEEVTGWKNHLGHKLIRRLEFHLDRMPMDVWDDRLLDLHFELFETKQNGLRRMIHKYESEWTPESLGKDEEVSMFIPLPFKWGYGDRPYLPLSAVTQSEMSILVTFAPLHDLVHLDLEPNTSVSIVPTGPGVRVKVGRPDEPWASYADDTIEPGEIFTNLWIETFHLTDQESVMIRNVDHDILLETHQVFEFSIAKGSSKFSLDFQDEGIRTPFPVKEWIIVFQTENQTDRFSYTVPVRMKRMWLSLDDYEHQLFRNSSIDQEGKFRWKNMYSKYHCISTKPIYTFTFSLYPTKYQPSGQLDMTRFRKKFLHIEFTDPIPETYRVSIYETRYPLLYLSDGTLVPRRI